MGHDRAIVPVSEDGSLKLSPEHRAALGISGAGRVVVEVVEGGLNVRNLRAEIRRVQDEAAAFLKDDSVDQFIADRHAEAAREEAGG